ncbi:MAG: hypothetical protein IOD01_06390 [Rhodobacter sp.]|nr:hypothetical protein [Rhodobacter sp.]
MTTLALSAPRFTGFAQLRQDAPLFTSLGIAMALSLLPTLAAMQIDNRLFHGESIWVKPIKFQIALTIYLLTLAFYARWLPLAMRQARLFRIYCGIVAAAIIAEVLWISGAAALGTASHFNDSSPVWGALYGFMGVAAVTLTSAALVSGIAIWRNRASGLPDALRLAVALGLVLTFVLTVPVAYYMSANTGHFVGTPADWDRGLPLMGWSRSVGDLRVAHFLATHALHGIPLAGLIAVLILPVQAARRAVLLASAGYAALVAATFVQALAGQPFL